jgi:hypothetical protein
MTSAILDRMSGAFTFVVESVKLRLTLPTRVFVSSRTFDASSIAKRTVETLP